MYLTVDARFTSLHENRLSLFMFKIPAASGILAVRVKRRTAILSIPFHPILLLLRRIQQV
jgi:hypothetical protein